jgi:poly(3-hydroxyalkanoate) depolymerase
VRTFSIEMVRAGSQWLRAGRRAGSGPPLLLFNGIGGNIELLEPFAQRMSREVIVFDLPGVGHSPMPRWPYRLRTIARLATQVLDHFGHRQCDTLGVSWGGAAAQQFARSEPERCRRLVLCATATGSLMVPARPGVLLKMATPARFMSADYVQRIAGDIYGGDFRRNPALAADVFRHVRWQSRLGYYLQLAAAAGWTSIHWLHCLKQPTLVMAGADDPIVPMANARLMRWLIPNAELKVMDCGHLFLLTRAEQSARAIEEFLGR